jgi:predicted negative regulator of RcsB-dependent stress response
LREAFASFYGAQQRDPSKSLELFNQVIDAWQRQPIDELAGLYRVRGDVFMANLDASSAIADYTQAIQLLQQDSQLSDPKADPTEFTASL